MSIKYDNKFVKQKRLQQLRPLRIGKVELGPHVSFRNLTAMYISTPGM